jgi:hypothetical protein
MSEENVEVVRNLYDELARGNHAPFPRPPRSKDRLLASTDDPEPGPHQGLDAAMGFIGHPRSLLTSTRRRAKSSTPQNGWSRGCGPVDAARRAGPPSTSRARSFTDSRMDASSRCASTLTTRKPSKLWGCETRLRRKRTSRPSRRFGRLSSAFIIAACHLLGRSSKLSASSSASWNSRRWRSLISQSGG